MENQPVSVLRTPVCLILYRGECVLPGESDCLFRAKAATDPDRKPTTFPFRRKDGAITVNTGGAIRVNGDTDISFYRSRAGS